MCSIVDSVSEELGILVFFGSCDMHAVADLVVREIRECRPKHQQIASGLNGPPAMHTSLSPVTFFERVQAVIDAIVSTIVTRSLDTQQITAGSVLGVLRAAREWSLSEEVAFADACGALVCQMKEAAGDLTATARDRARSD